MFIVSRTWHQLVTKQKSFKMAFTCHLHLSPKTANGHMRNTIKTKHRLWRANWWMRLLHVSFEIMPLFPSVVFRNLYVYQYTKPVFWMYNPDYLLTLLQRKKSQLERQVTEKHLFLTFYSLFYTNMTIFVSYRSKTFLLYV